LGSSYVDIASAVAREAGALINDFLARRIGFELKGEFDVVTQADRASEKLIVTRLKKEFPTHAILAEEGGAREGSSEFRWYVDPLDGTTNFAHGFPVFNVSIGLERAGELIAGVIYDPTRDELFTAEKGAGAFLNSQPICVSQTARIQSSLLATGFPSRKRHLNVNIHFYYQIAMLSHGVRRPGAAALDLAYVACGRLDGFWEFALNPWDVAAGILLIREAGGTCTSMSGAPLALDGPHLLADNGAIHAEMLHVFSEIFAGRYAFPLPEINRG